MRKVVVKKWQHSEAELARGKNNGARGLGPEWSALEGGWEAVTLPDRMSEPWEVDNNSGRPRRLPPLAADPELARSHAPSLKNQQPSLKTHPSPTALTQQAREAPRNPLGEIQSPDLILRTSHHRKEEKIMKLSTFQLAIPLHRGGTGQGLAALQLFLPSDFRNCLPILVTGHHSKLSSVHSNHKTSKPQCAAGHGHTHPYPGHTGPNSRVKCQGPRWTVRGQLPPAAQGSDVMRRTSRPTASGPLEEGTQVQGSCFNPSEGLQVECSCRLWWTSSRIVLYSHRELPCGELSCCDPVLMVTDWTMVSLLPL